MISTLNSSVALITAIEGDLLDINTRKQGYYRQYEQEAIKCFTEWRKNGGGLRDIPIYTIALTNHPASRTTQRILEDLGVTYIEDYHPETENYQNGYWNIPLAGKYFEERLSVDTLIKIDLDMYLIKPMERFLFSLEHRIPLVGRYDDDSAKHDTNKLIFPARYGRPWDTGLIISHRESGFYAAFYDKLKQLTAEYEAGIFEDKYGLRVKRQDDDIGVDYGAIEEFAISVMHTDDKVPLREITKYNLGEFYVPIDSYTDDEVPGIYFFHEHIPCSELGYDKTRTRINYKKRMTQIAHRVSSCS